MGGLVQVLLYRRRSPRDCESDPWPPDSVHPLLGPFWALGSSNSILYHLALCSLVFGWVQPAGEWERKGGPAPSLLSLHGLPYSSSALNTVCCLGIGVLIAPYCCQSPDTTLSLAGLPDLTHSSETPFLLSLLYESVFCLDPDVSPLTLSPTLLSLSPLAWAPALLLAGWGHFEILSGAQSSWEDPPGVLSTNSKLNHHSFKYIRSGRWGDHSAPEASGKSFAPL